MDLTPEQCFTPDDVEAGVRILHANHYDGDELLDEAARDEIVRLVLSVVAPRIRAEAYRAGREDAARDIAAACERARDAAPMTPGWFAYDHAAGLARLYRVPDCGDEYHGADGGPCRGCGFDAAEAGDQPRTVSAREQGDNPEERTDG